VDLRKKHMSAEWAPIIEDCAPPNDLHQVGWKLGTRVALRARWSLVNLACGCGPDWA
jgi:hypothetical protein